MNRAPCCGGQEVKIAKKEPDMKKRLLAGLATGVTMLGLVGMAQADTITLNGTIRDFKSGAGPASGGVWFEGAIDGLKTGLLQTTLDDTTKNPLRTGTATDSMPGDQSFFNTWYNDVPGTNLTASYAINLNQVGSTNTYKYSSNAFFPIDGQLFGNQGNSHNYHFTYGNLEI